MDMGQAAVECRYRIDVADWSSTCPLNLCAVKFRCYGADHLLRDLVLQIENVLQRAVKPVRPEVRAGRNVNELSGDPQAGSRLAHAAFEHIPHAEFATDLFDVDGLAF